MTTNNADTLHVCVEEKIINGGLCCILRFDLFLRS
jgi:hypothetical protein